MSVDTKVHTQCVARTCTNHVIYGLLPFTGLCPRHHVDYCNTSSDVYAPAYVPIFTAADVAFWLEWAGL